MKEQGRHHHVFFLRSSSSLSALNWIEDLFLLGGESRESFVCLFFTQLFSCRMSSYVNLVLDSRLSNFHSTSILYSDFLLLDFDSMMITHVLSLETLLLKIVNCFLHILLRSSLDSFWSVLCLSHWCPDLGETRKLTTLIPWEVRREICEDVLRYFSSAIESFETEIVIIISFVSTKHICSLHLSSCLLILQSFTQFYRANLDLSVASSLLRGKEHQLNSLQFLRKLTQKRLDGKCAIWRTTYTQSDIENRKSRERTIKTTSWEGGEGKKGGRHDGMGRDLGKISWEEITRRCDARLIDSDNEHWISGIQRSGHSCKTLAEYQGIFCLFMTQRDSFMIWVHLDVRTEMTLHEEITWRNSERRTRGLTASAWWSSAGESFSLLNSQDSLCSLGRRQ